MLQPCRKSLSSDCTFFESYEVMVEETRDMGDDDDEGRLPLLPAMGVECGIHIGVELFL